ncbi:hypothetical protein CK203_052699 [Vitis vinifera]|uniref:Uncharacterized protein n=1 Tax=Vitis vinifera TaxID=29760 RepID=A0A438GCP1_VITVI|nr:hypothetical protein CK203_052699 [Vitis vinifera]
MDLGSNLATDNALNLPGTGCCVVVSTPRFGSPWRVQRAWSWKGVDIQLGMAIDSTKATLAVKRRLACEMVKYCSSAIHEMMTCKPLFYNICCRGCLVLNDRKQRHFVKKGRYSAPSSKTKQ